MLLISRNNVGFAVGQVEISGMWDTYANLAGNIASIYSLRRRVSTYTGPLVRVRDTDDDSEQDVGYDALTNKLNAFTVVGAARVVTWYDQVGGLDKTQATNSRQPRLDPAGAPNGEACVDHAGGAYTLRAPNFSDASPNAHHIARPTWIGAFVGANNGVFKYAWFVPHKELTHGTPYYRAGMIWEPDEGIETRWNGTIRQWGGSAASGLTGNALLMQDLHSDITRMETYVNSTALNTSIASAGNFTAPNITNVMMGTNSAHTEQFNGKFMELMLGDFGIRDAALRTKIYDDIDSAFYGKSTRWRVGNATATGDPSVAGLQFRDTVGGANTTVGGTATESSFYSSAYKAGKAFDADPATLWASNSGPAWIEYEFPNPITIVEIMMQARTGSFSNQTPTTFDLQYYDGAAWVTVLAVAGGASWSSGEIRIFTV